MGNKIKFDPFQNSAKNFEPIMRDLERIAKKSDIPVSEIVSNFIIDLENYYNKEYKKRVDMDLKGVTPYIQSSLITYLNKMKRLYKQKETSKAKKEKKITSEQQLQDKWSEIESSIEGNIMDPKVMKKIMDDIENSDLSRKEKNSMKAKLDEKRIKFAETWNRIEEIVEEKNSENDNRTKPEYWQAIRNLIVQRDKSLNIKMNEEMEKQMISMIDERISSEKDNLYYEQVKSFTNDFSFLRDDTLVIRATTGTRREKFTDRESYDRYCNLRSMLQEVHRREYQGIEKLLNYGKVNSGDRRILEQRIKVMQKEASKMPDAR